MAEEISEIRLRGLDWDRIRIRPPLCYLPPIWEILINREINPELVKKIGIEDPHPDPWHIEKHMNNRIKIVKELVAGKKLDAKLGELAVAHFQEHLTELKALQVKRA